MDELLKMIIEIATEEGIKLISDGTKQVINKKFLNKNRTFIIDGFDTNFQTAQYSLRVAPSLVGTREYQYATITNISFGGNFGSKPKVLMVYSKDDSPIRLDDSKKLQVSVLTKNRIIYNKYYYKTNNENHYSSKKPEVLKPYIFICFDKNMKKYGMNILLVLDTAKGNAIKYPNGVIHAQPQRQINFVAEGWKIISIDNIKELLLPQIINGKEYHVSDEDRIAIDKIIKELNSKIYRE
ncbi:hypothetical protein [Limosilactobacillus reuteri]|uniref:hypothetical protein n=1 Tax=Limosilactobacillus reuteri TaxID=1598 RepID=UPI001C58E1E9|nr:hypothetical protein [Limosilactobacillus reuteri]MBW3349184.1 hypothetical protein [Limosilactobacillus reuteri]UUW67943.1 hypothetical protein NUJ10_08005 [Limosilactobacillus reuteri]